MLAKTLKFLFKTCLVLMAFVLIYGGTTWLFAQFPIQTERDTSPKPIQIWITSNGVHTDIVMPIQNTVFNWEKIVTPQDTQGKQTAQYVAMGWGDKPFYLETRNWEDLKISNALRAILGMNETLMHVSFYPNPLIENEYTRTIWISEAEYTRLTASISASFARNSDGKTIPIDGAFYHQNDVFYLAQGRYHLFQTCNTWSNQQLKQSGLPSLIWTPFSHQLLSVY